MYICIFLNLQKRFFEYSALEIETLFYKKNNMFQDILYIKQYQLNIQILIYQIKKETFGVLLI